jgi:hypothetical protein
LLLKGNTPCAAFEFKYSNSPTVSKGNTEALNDLGRPAMFIVTPTAKRASLRPGIDIIAMADLPGVLRALGASA